MSGRAGKSKIVATWLAICGGTLGLHRFYLHGFGDAWGWFYPLPTLLGLLGIRRALDLGQDDRVAWVLIPLLGITLTAAMLSAIICALMPDERWDQRFNVAGPPTRSGWPVVIGAALALLLGAGVLMATVAFTGQRFFEYQAATRH